MLPWINAANEEDTIKTIKKTKSTVAMWVTLKSMGLGSIEDM